MRFKSQSLFAPIAFATSLILLGQESVTPKKKDQVLFVCEHGNVKSLMAVSYFNQLAQQKGLLVRAISRGASPDSDTVPSVIAEGLKKDGLDVSGFHPKKVLATEMSESRQVILINTELPLKLRSPDAVVESWSDIPPASVDFLASSKALKLRIEALITNYMAQSKK